MFNLVLSLLVTHYRSSLWKMVILRIIRCCLLSSKLSPTFIITSQVASI